MMMKKRSLAIVLALALSGATSAEETEGLDIRESGGDSDTQEMADNAPSACFECSIPLILEACAEEGSECEELSLPPN